MSYNGHGITPYYVVWSDTHRKNRDALLEVLKEATIPPLHLYELVEKGNMVHSHGCPCGECRCSKSMCGNIFCKVCNEPLATVDGSLEQNYEALHYYVKYHYYNKHSGKLAEVLLESHIKLA